MDTSVGRQNDCAGDFPGLRSRREMRAGQGADPGLALDDAAEAEPRLGDAGAREARRPGRQRPARPEGGGGRRRR